MVHEIYKENTENICFSNSTHTTYSFLSSLIFNPLQPSMDTLHDNLALSIELLRQLGLATLDVQPDSQEAFVGKMYDPSMINNELANRPRTDL